MDVDKVVQNIQRICRERGTTPTVAARESGAGKSLVTQMKRQGIIPSVEKMSMLAAYLGVTTSELLGEGKEPTPEDRAGPMDSMRSTLLRNFDRLNQEGRERLVETSDDMVSSGKYIKSDPDGLGQKKA